MKGKRGTTSANGSDYAGGPDGQRTTVAGEGGKAGFKSRSRGLSLRKTTTGGNRRVRGQGAGRGTL